MIDIWDILDEIKISYIVLDIESKRDASEKLSGALLGVGVMHGLTDLADTNVDYLWLGTGAGGVRIEALNVEDFQIDTIHMGMTNDKEESGKVQSISFSASPDENLKRAKKLVSHISEKCKTMMEEGSFLIDFSKYSDLTTMLKEKIEKGTKVESKNRGGGQVLVGGSEDGDDSGTEDIYGGGHNPHACGYRGGNYAGGSTTTVVKKVVSTKNFKRTSKYAIGPAIESMRKKIEALKAGTYTAPELPALKIVEEKKEDNKSVAEKNWHHVAGQEYYM